MKRNVKNLLLLFLAFGMFALNSCKEELPTMSCKIDSKSWISTFRVTTMGEVDLGNGAGGYLVTATNGTDASLSDGEYLAILIRGTDTKEYSLSVALYEGKYECAVVYFPEGLNVGTKYVGNTGSVEITDINDKKKKVSGKFSFEMKKSIAGTESGAEAISITDGVFENLKYSEPGALALSLFEVAAQ